MLERALFRQRRTRLPPLGFANTCSPTPIRIRSYTDRLEVPTRPLTTTTATTYSSRLQSEIDAIGFGIFQHVADKGYVLWSPHQEEEQGYTYKNLSRITRTNEITDFVVRDSKPSKLVSQLSTFRLPRRFTELDPVECINKFPYGQHEIASLHVAVQDRGVNLNTIDFVFGGSTLEMLAQCSNSKPYMLSRIPGTQAILVVHKSEYTANLAAHGHQFERLVTGKGLVERRTLTDSSDHMQIMQVGPYRVLFIAEVDAICPRDESPVEIKLLNTHFFGTKVLFQMMSSGSTKLCHGVRMDDLMKVTLHSLGEVAKVSRIKSRGPIRRLEDNILKGMSSIMTAIKAYSEEECPVFQISFADADDTLTLRPVHGESAHILPPDKIVHALLT